MQCASCNHDNEEGRSFCAECGKPLPLDCPSCGLRNNPGVKFCGSCGGALGSGRSAIGPGPQRASQILTQPESFVDGRYKVVRIIGEGSSKTVYLAHDNKIDRDIAFALIKTAGLDASGRERISREARAMGRLGDNPYIVAIYDVGEERGQPYIVSQYMAGGSVDDLLRRSENHRLASADAVRIACDVCQALDYAHSRGIIHRDLKPANVWLTADGTTKLGDFGLAIASDRSRLTAAGMIVGTAAYMPPEQALGKPLDARSDLYSLGAMIYEMVTGQPPFRGDDLLSVIAQHVNAIPDAPSKKVGGIAPALDALILKLLAKNPTDRPDDADAVRRTLEPMLTPAATTIDNVAASVVMERPNLQAHAAPDGTVSILFSDIENSTMMTERLGDLRAQEVLHEHNDLIRKQVAEQKGFEVKSMGDGFMVAFSSARRALLCAIGIQRTFEDYSKQHPTEPIRVRIGLHMGEAISEGGDFFGKTVIMAARIGAKANAGEILVSSVFKAVTESAGDLKFDAGYDVELKGLSGSYHVYRAMWAPPGAEAPPATDATPPRGTLIAAARETTTTPAPDMRSHGWLIGSGIVVVVLLAGGLFAYRFIPHGEQPSTAPTAPPTAAAQVAPIAQANQAAAPPAPVATQVAAAEPTAPVAVVAPPTRDARAVRVDAPGISPERLQKALKAVSNWLNLRDQGRYVKAWNDSTFIVTREDWIKGQETIYARRGNVVSRRLEVEQLSPARNPERMLFRYKTYFEKGRWVYEFVYVIPKPNGKWIVTGYFIKMDSDPTTMP
jgi:serine/threonine protein kinase